MTGAAIAWPEALQLAQWAVARPSVVAASVDAAIAGHPPFRNREYPLSPVPVVLRPEAVSGWRPQLEAYVRLLGKVVTLFREVPAVRDWYGLDPLSTRLVEADTRLGDAPVVCRLDGYLDQQTERLWVLENNADAPAGTLFTARINGVVDEILRTAGLPISVAATYGSGEALLRTLLDVADRTGVTPRAIGVLQPREAPNRESVELVQALVTAGFDAFLADPRDASLVRGRACFGGRTADVVWNKVNTASWRVWAAAGDLTERWEAVLRGSDLVHVNPFGARFVAENKLTLAFLQDPAFSDLFDDAERETVATLLPWARRVTREATGPTGRAPLVDELIDQPGEWVLKQDYDIRGDGVTIGHDVTAPTWRAAVASSLADGGLAQRRVRPVSYPVVGAGTARVEAMPISLDSFVLDGRLVGFGAKASRNAKVNIFQGGQKLAVHVREEINV